MKNFRKLGDTITLPAPYQVASGAGALVGTIFGVAQAAYAAGASGEFLRRGLVTMPKAAGGATTIGQKAYWDDTNKVVTTTVGGNKLIGAFMTVQAAGDTSADVLLMPTAA